MGYDSTLNKHTNSRVFFRFGESQELIERFVSYDRIDFIYGTYIFLGGGFKYFSFSPLFGEDSHFD